jgi:hypothetical protein
MAPVPVGPEGRGKTMSIDFGRLFRQEWVAGVLRHYPGEPKPGYVADGEAMPGWQREVDADIFDAVEARVGE